MKNKINGVINVYKPKGPTSFQIVHKLRKLLKVKKIGHTGTLDPQAEGVLVICIGEATKIAHLLTNTKKVYEAEIIFGIETDTWDMEGSILREAPCRGIEKRIKEILPLFQGEVEQIPPMYSAISYKGERLYKLARRGEVVERKPRKVNIYKLEFLRYLEGEHSKLKLLIECSSGTYIRTLAYDLGQKIGCPSSLTNLIRKRVGNFSLENSLSIDEIKDYVRENKVEEILIPIEKALDFINIFPLTIHEKNKVKDGQRIYIRDIRRLDNMDPSLLLATYEGKPVALGKIIIEQRGYLFKPIRVFNI